MDGTEPVGIGDGDLFDYVLRLVETAEACACQPAAQQGVAELLTQIVKVLQPELTKLTAETDDPMMAITGGTWMVGQQTAEYSKRSAVVANKHDLLQLEIHCLSLRNGAVLAVFATP